MARYEPYPLLDFQGLDQAKESWLTPQNAWRDLSNGFVYRGRLRKREGATFSQWLGIAHTENIGNIGDQAIIGNLSNVPWLAPSLDAVESSTPIPASDYNVRFKGESIANGPMVIVIGSVFLITDEYIWFDCYEEGTEVTPRGQIMWNPTGVVLSPPQPDGKFIVNFPFPSDAIQPTVEYEYASQQPVTGIHLTIGPDGTEYNLATDTDRLWLMTDTEERYYEKTTGIVWTGSEDDIFNFGDYDDICVINNGVDPPQKFSTGTQTVSAMATDVDGVPGNDIEAAQMFFNYLGYGVYLGVKESGTWYRGRARWTQNGNPEIFSSANDFLDAPANDVIVSAGIVGGELFVGFRDVGWWKFEATNDPTDPFRWVPVESELGSVAQNSTVSLADRLLTRNRYGLTAINRMGEADAAPQLGDLPLTWDAENAYRTNALKYDARRQVWWTYAGSGSEMPDKILVMQRQPDGSYSYGIYNLGYTAIGLYRASKFPVWDSISDVMNTIEYSMDAPSNQGGFPTIAAGDLTGSIFKFAGAGQDRSGYMQRFDSVVMSAKSARLNPYPGYRARLGWLDIIADRNTEANLEIRFYADYESFTYKAIAVSLDDGSSSSKIIKRIRVNKTATFHTIEIHETGDAAVVIDYLAPYFKRAGR